MELQDSSVSSLSNTGECLVADMRYTTLKALLEKTDETEGGSLKANQVSPAQFSEIHKERDVRGRKIRLFYLAADELLIITLPTKPHETLHSRLYEYICIQIVGMGLFPPWGGSGATGYSPTTLSGASSASQAKGTQAESHIPRSVQKDNGRPLFSRRGTRN